MKSNHRTFGSILLAGAFLAIGLTWGSGGAWATELSFICPDDNNRSYELDVIGGPEIQATVAGCMCLDDAARLKAFLQQYARDREKKGGKVSANVAANAEHKGPVYVMKPGETKVFQFFCYTSAQIQSYVNSYLESKKPETQ